MKRIIISILGLMAVGLTYAQEQTDSTHWTRGGDYSFNFSQVQFTNWAGGGLNAISGVTQLNVFSNYKSDNTLWENKLQIGYGITSQEGLDPQKSEDVLDFQSKYGLKANNKWFYSVLFNFKSQFTDGYSDAENTNKISSLFAPAHATLSVGMDYKPNDNFAVLISPLAGKATIVVDDELIGLYGIDEDKNARIEMGAQIAASYNAEVVKNVNLATDVKLFSNYLDQPQNIDLDWQVAINMKINDYLSAKVTTRLIYDDNIKTPNKDTEHLAPQIQFKELFGIGLNLKF